MATADPIVKKKIEINDKIQPPRMYKVVYLNDDITSVEFVIESLCTVFNYTQESGADLAIKIHNEGAATVAVLPYEIAEQKGVEVTVLARNNGFPLSVRLEPEA